MTVPWHWRNVLSPSPRPTEDTALQATAQWYMGLVTNHLGNYRQAIDLPRAGRWRYSKGSYAMSALLLA